MSTTDRQVSGFIKRHHAPLVTTDELARLRDNAERSDEYRAWWLAEVEKRRRPEQNIVDAILDVDRPPAPPQPVRRGSYADHRLQFPELYAPPTPTADALLTCLIVVLDHPDSLATITLVAETRGCGIGTVALELARKMAAAGIRER